MSESLVEMLRGLGAVLGGACGGVAVSTTEIGPPLHFGDFDGEYESLRSGAGLVDLSRRTQLEFTGDDRASFLHNLCTSDIKKLPAGSGVETCITNVQGKLLGFGWVFAGPESQVYETVPGQGEKLAAHFERYHIREKVTITDRSQDWAELLVGGAGAAALLKRAGFSPPTQPLAGMLIEENSTALRRVEGYACPAWLISTPRTSIIGLWQRLLAAGARPCGETALEAQRIEAGFPAYGQDATTDTLPQELDRDRTAIHFTKGCYLGQETVARIDALGHVNWHLRRVRFPAGAAPTVGATIESDGKTLLRITSSSWNPRLQSPLALAMVRRGHHEPGTKLPADGGEAEILPPWSSEP